MQSFAQSPVQMFRRFIARLRAWKLQRAQRSQFVDSLVPHIMNVAPPLHREVTASGVRFYSLCGDCGAQLNASATLCDECAQKRSRPARPY